MLPKKQLERKSLEYVLFYLKVKPTRIVGLTAVPFIYIKPNPQPVAPCGKACLRTSRS